MNPNDSLQGALKKLELPHLPQQGINSFLNEVFTKANPVGNPAALSGDLSRSFASMTSAADWSRQLLRSFEPPKSPFQKVIDESARSAAVYRNLGSLAESIAKAAASMRTTAELNREMMRSIQPPKSPLQGIIDTAQAVTLKREFSSLSGGIAKAAASIRTSADINREMLRSIQLPRSSIQGNIAAGQNAAWKLNLELFREHTGAISKLAQLYSRPQFGGPSSVIQQAMAAGQMWQSSRITDFASRVISQPAFRQAVIERLESEELPEGQAVDAQISSQQVLEAVERGIEESVAIQRPDDIQASVNGMFSWWAKLPPNLRNHAVTFLIGILLLLVEYGLFVKDQPTSQLPANQRVKIVQKITNNIFVNVGVSPEERRQFRVVTKDELPVFRSNRRDSGKIGTLTAGKVVTVKIQKRNWTLVEWQDADSQEMRVGWVFTRYLRKISAL